MPWRIEQKDDQYCVVKESSGEPVGCHPSREKAKSQLRALYANVQDSAVSEFSFAIIKAQLKDGEMRIRMTSSDTDKDYYDERMSEELFDDFLSHIENEDEIPEPFKSAICEEGWCGGMPYISLAHYKSGKDGVNVPGEIKAIYRDGKVLKSTAVLYDNPLGKAIFKSLQKDLVEKRDDKIRISIGFLDLEHSHGDKFSFIRRGLTDKCPLCKEGVGDKIYKKGFLVHKALTRVPANPRTDVEVERAMTTKREDAESIVEDEEVIKTLDLKSQAEDVLVIKSDEPVVEQAKEMDCEEGDEDCKKKHAEMHKEEKSDAVEQPVVVASTTDSRGYKETEVATAPEISVEVRTVENTPLEKSLSAVRTQVETIKSQGLTGDNALKELQSVVDNLGNVLRAEFEPKPSPEQVANQNLEATLRSLLSEMLPAALAQTVAPIQSELSELRALSLVRPVSQPKKEEVPQPRSLQLNLAQKSAIDKVVQKTNGLKSFAQIANETVGLQ